MNMDKSGYFVAGFQQAAPEFADDSDCDQHGHQKNKTCNDMIADDFISSSHANRFRLNNVYLVFRRKRRF